MHVVSNSDAPALEHRALHGLLDVAERLNASTDLTEILSIIIDALRTTLEAERATIFEYDAKADELYSTVAHGISGAAPGAEIRIPADAGLAGECAQRRCTINVLDAYADDRFNPEVDRRTGFRTRSILTMPLLAHDGDLVGVVQVLNRRKHPFGTEDEQVAVALASLATLAIKRARLIEDRLVRQRLERDLALARWIHERTFPAHLPALDGFEIDAWSEAADETGGDTYDAIAVRRGADGAPRATDDGSSEGAVLLLADAAGHGIGPALSVTQIRSMLRMAVRIGVDLPTIARHLNAQLYADLPSNRFITAWLAELRSGTGELVSFAAGQGPLLVYRRATDAVETWGSDAVPFGVLPALDECEPRTVTLEPGDVFAVISDGIFEARAPEGPQLGVGPVSSLIRTGHDAPLPALIAGIRALVGDHTQGAAADDDRTVLVIRRR